MAVAGRDRADGGTAQPSAEWLRIGLRQLAALAAVGREGSFAGAATSLGYVQSAVSQQITRLEQLVGTQLVERGRGTGGVRLTPAGQRLVLHFEQMQVHLGAARADLAALQSDSTTTVRVGVFQSVAMSVMPGTLALLATRSPELQIEISEEASDRHMGARVARGELDVAFAELPVPDGPFVACELLRDRCVLVVAADSELARRDDRVAALEEVAELSLVGHPTWRYNTRIEEALQTRGLQARYSVFSETNAATQTAVATGLADAAIMPALAVDATARDSIAIVDLDPAIPPRTLALYWHRERRQNRALEDFRAAVLDSCANIFPEDVIDGPR